MENDEIPLPQPQYGMPIKPELEYTDYMSKVHTFQYDEEKKKLGQEDCILEGYFPPDFLKYFWGYLTPDHIWTNNQEKDIRSLRSQLKASRDLYLKTIPPRQLNHERIRQLDNLEAYIMSRLMRGLHGWERQKMTESTQQTLYGQVQQQQPATGIRKIMNPFGNLFRV
jgi:hypothetical protein